MRIWFDTEFYEDGRTIELISIGAVRADGALFYCETHDALELAQQSDWLKQNVLPHLHPHGTSRERKSKAEIGREFRVFAGEKPEFWAWYSAYDWVVLCQLYGRMIDLPQGWSKFCHDLKQLAGDIELPKQESVEHHALEDARWTRDAHLWLLNKLHGVCA